MGAAAQQPGEQRHGLGTEGNAQGAAPRRNKRRPLQYPFLLGQSPAVCEGAPHQSVADDLSTLDSAWCMLLDTPGLAEEVPVESRTAVLDCGFTCWTTSTTLTTTHGDGAPLPLPARGIQGGVDFMPSQIRGENFVWAIWRFKLAMKFPTRNPTASAKLAPVAQLHRACKALHTGTFLGVSLKFTTQNPWASAEFDCSRTPPPPYALVPATCCWKIAGNLCRLLEAWRCFLKAPGCFLVMGGHLLIIFRGFWPALPGGLWMISVDC